MICIKDKDDVSWKADANLDFAWNAKNLMCKVDNTESDCGVYNFYVLSWNLWL